MVDCRSKRSEVPFDGKDLFEAVEQGRTQDALKLIAKRKTINVYDATRMPILGEACFRGNIIVAEQLIKRGCDVNDSSHHQGFTCLMFATLSGNVRLCQLLMDYGAKPYATNHMGKSATELGAFVGHHECVCVINNYIGVKEIEKFLHPDGEKSEEIFPQELVVFIHDICKSHRVHPVAILLRLAKYPDALKYKKKILYVVDRVFERQLRCKESNEVMSLKLWIILFILREAIKVIDEQTGKDPSAVVITYCKFLLQMEPGNQIRRNLENLLRNAVRSFPYHHSLLFDTLVKAIAKVPLMSRPSAYEFIVQSLFGHRILACSKFCSTCGTPNANKKCSICKFPYCSRDCQKFDWGSHKLCCESIKGWNIQMLEDMISMEELQEQMENIDI